MTDSHRKRRWRRLGLLLLLLLLGYGTYRAVRPDPNLKRVKQLREEFAAHAREWSAEERQAKGQQMREAMDRLSAGQREAMAAEGRQRFQQELERYARLSPAEKTRYLDERINQTDASRRQLAGRNPASGPRGRPGTFAAGPEGPGGWDRGQPASAEERERRRKERLDRTTPEFRALMDQFRNDLAARRQQRGRPAGTGR